MHLDVFAARDDPDEDVRHAQAQALDAQSADDAGFALWLSLLGDPSWRVRRVAAARWSLFRSRADLAQALVAALGDADNAGLRNAAADCLAQIGADAVQPLIDAIETEDYDKRKFVIEILGTLATPKALEVLLKHREQPDENLSVAILDALGRVGGGKAIEAIIEALDAAGDDLQKAAYALDALGGCGACLDFERLQPWLDYRPLGRLVFPLLGRCHDARAFEPLLAALLAGTVAFQRSAVLALASLFDNEAAIVEAGCACLAQDPNAALRLLEWLEEGDDNIALAALRILASLADPKHTVAVLSAVSRRAFVRQGMATILAIGPAVIPPILIALKDLPADIQILAMRILADLHAVEAIGAIQSLAKESRLEVALEAERALGHIGSLCIADRLMAQIIDGGSSSSNSNNNSSSSRSNKAALVALEKLANQEPKAIADKIRARLEAGDLRPEWLLVLGRCRQKEDGFDILAAATHPDAKIRIAALKACADISLRLPPSIWQSCLADPDPDVRCAAAHALAHCGSMAVMLLLSMTEDHDPRVVAAAVAALGYTGDRRAVPMLCACVGSPDAYVAIAALAALRGLLPDVPWAAVKRGLSHAHDQVVVETVHLLDGMQGPKASNYLLAALAHRHWCVRRTAVHALLRRSAYEVIPNMPVHAAHALERETCVLADLEELLRAIDKGPKSRA